jgi:hypothetical protein
VRVLGRLRETISNAVTGRLTPERTRRPTLFERLTVRRLDDEWVLRLHPWLELVGKATTILYSLFIASVVLGANWKDTVESTLNGGRPVKAAIVLAIVVPTLLFIAARSMIGWLRWRLQRELWRRDVERLSADRLSA